MHNSSLRIVQCDGKIGKQGVRALLADLIGNYSLKGFQKIFYCLLQSIEVVFDSRKNCLCINFKIAMGYVISDSNYILPRYFWTSL